MPHLKTPEGRPVRWARPSSTEVSRNGAASHVAWTVHVIYLLEATAHLLRGDATPTDVSPRRHAANISRGVRSRGTALPLRPVRGTEEIGKQNCAHRGWNRAPEMQRLLARAVLSRPQPLSASATSRSGPTAGIQGGPNRTSRPVRLKGVELDHLRSFKQHIDFSEKRPLLGSVA